MQHARYKHTSPTVRHQIELVDVEIKKTQRVYTDNQWGKQRRRKGKGTRLCTTFGERDARIENRGQKDEKKNTETKRESKATEKTRERE